jgi:hypothetical protein
MKSILRELGGNHPWGFGVAVELLSLPRGSQVVAAALRNGVVGPSLWYAYSQCCNGSIEELGHRLLAADGSMPESFGSDTEHHGCG